MGCCASAIDETGGQLKSASNGGTVHDGILRERNADVYDKYEEIEVLGRGSMGHVAKVRVKDGREGGSAFNKKVITKRASSSLSERRKNKVEYALKSIQLDRVSPQFLTELRNEIDILKGMDHPNIVKAYEVFSHKKQIYLILELCDGGDLYTRLPYSEKQAAMIVGKLVSAVKYLHDHRVVHRDLKFENIMFENKTENAEIKVRNESINLAFSRVAKWNRFAQFLFTIGCYR